jgi:hypothetical protein
LRLQTHIDQLATVVEEMFTRNELRNYEQKRSLRSLVKDHNCTSTEKAK